MSSAEYSCRLFKPFFVYRQTVWPLIRLLQKEQSDLGPHCLQKWLLKSQADDKADNNSCDWQFKGSWTNAHMYISVLDFILNKYRIYPKYSDTSAPYHICSKIWTGTIHYPMLCLKIAGWVANSVDPDETPRSVASHLGLSPVIRKNSFDEQRRYL